MKPKATHTSCKKNKKVLITLRSGKKILDKFLEKKSKGVVLKEYGFIETSKIRNFTIYKNQKS